MNVLKILILIVSFIMITVSCEVEKIVEVEKEVEVEARLIFSADTLRFTNNETRELFITTKPATTCNFQVVKTPDWVTVNPKSGIMHGGNFAKISLQANFTNMQPDLLSGELVIMSTLGMDTIALIGVVDDHLSYSLPDSVTFSVLSSKEKLVLRNLGNISLNYTINSSENYIDMSVKTGVVPVGEEAEITLDLNRENLETGTYFSKLYLSINEVPDSVIVKIENLKEKKRIIESDVVDAEYSKATDKLVYVSSDFTLNIYTAATATIETVTLAFVPTCLSLSLDGTKAVVGHDGRVTYVDLITRQILNTLDVSCKVNDIVLSENGWTYIFPSQTQWSRIFCIDVNLSNATESQHTGNSIYAGTKAKLHPSGKYIYGADNGLSPSDLEKYDIQNGTAVYLYDSPYHGDYSIGGDLWFSQDGNRIFTRSKTVFKTSEIREHDLRYNGSITLEGNNTFNYSRIIWLDHLELKKNLYLLSTGDDNWRDPNKPFVYVHNSENLTFRYKIELEKYLVTDSFGSGKLFPPEPYFVFSKSSGEEIYVITKALGSGLINEWAIQTYDIE